MKNILTAAGALAMLVACGGGGGGGSTGSMPQAGMQSVVTMGTITAFGSVYVNGVRYGVSAATLTKNDTTVAQSGLAVGEVALVRGREDIQTGQGDADSVDVEDSVVGPAMITGSQLTVLGQTISITASTSFGPGITPADLTGLTSGDSIEVDGLPGMGGVIMATRIARAESTEPLQVLGTIGMVDTTAHTFTINALTVDYSTATLSGFAMGQPAAGNLVIARGTVFDATAVKLTATKVRRAETDRDDQSEGGMVEEEGLITSFTSATQFEVAGAMVTTTASTVFKNGTAADLALNVRVEVRGTLDANKVLVADVVEIEHIAAIALEATVSATTSSTLTVLGVTVSVDTNTRFEDRSSTALEMFTLKDVMVGDTVFVRGYEHPAGSGMVLATRLERLMPSTAVRVRGPFTATTAPQFKILSITIDATNANFSKGEDQGLTAAEFFAQAVGQIVDVRGTATGSTVMANTAMIDTEEDR